MLDFYLFIYLSVKRNFVTERKSLVLGFLTSLRNTPSSQEMFPLFWCVVPHSQSVPSLTDFPPDTITLATTQRNQQRDDSVTLPKQKKMHILKVTVQGNLSSAGVAQCLAKASDLN